MHLQKGFSIANLLGALLSLACMSAILVAYYFIHQSSSSTDNFEINIETLNKLQQLDANWTVAILKTRSYTLQHFDRLAFYLLEINNELKNLEKEGILDENRVGKNTVNQYQIYKHSFGIKNEAVEHYKSQQAILRNSVRYLPHIGNELQQIFSEKDTLNGTNQSNLVAASLLLVNRSLLSGTIANKKIKEKLDKLELKSTNENSKIQKKIRSYLTHVKLILIYKEKVKQMLNTTMSSDIGSLSGEVVHEYTRFQDIEKLRIKHLQKIILTAAVILLVIFFWFLLRLRKSGITIVRADARNQISHKKLLQIERTAASGQLAIGTFKHLNKKIPILSQHLTFLNNLNMDKSLAEHASSLNLLIKDINYFRDNIIQLDTLIDPQANQNKEVKFSFNDIIQKVLFVISFEVGQSIRIATQWGNISNIQASPINLYQIVLKVICKAVEPYKLGTKIISIKTWATTNFANMHISFSHHNVLKNIDLEEELAVVRELLEQNKGELNITQTPDKVIVQISFPYHQESLLNQI